MNEVARDIVKEFDEEFAREIGEGHIYVDGCKREVKIVPILPKGRYAVVGDWDWKEADVVRIRLEEWWNKGGKFLVIGSGAELVRVDEREDRSHMTIQNGSILYY